MSKIPNDYHKVVSFIKQNRPLPPPESATLENQLFHKISRTSTTYNQKNSLKLWLLFGALTVSLATIWGGHRWFQPSYQITKKTRNLEAFMVEGWQGTMGESSLDSDWLPLDNSPQEYLVYTP
ncbi:MAG TPA: hypothetical protein DCF68_10625 [Cyanothece sp. UBA12306]|nr:hypothetical protein [Cyanothece sp. UBA12306]